MGYKKKLFLSVWLAGFAGIVSFLFVDLNAIIEVVPLPPGTEMPMGSLALKLVSLVQPTILMSIATLIGVGLASKVGLHAPVAESIAAGDDKFAALKPQIAPGIIGGIVGGMLIVAIAAVAKPMLPAEAVVLIGKFGNLLPLVTRFLYGGLSEEVLLRWGLMSLLVWAMWRVFQKGEGSVKSPYFVIAILVSSFIFGLGHLPVALMLFPEPTPVFVLFVIVANSTFGLIAGLLYWKKGLESAMLAHIITHIALFTASRLGTYF